MELFGKGYVIDYCTSLFKQKQEDKILRIYITDGLKVITDTLRGVYGGSSLSKRYIDVIDPPPEDNRTADDIIGNIKSKLKALGGDNDKSV